MKPIKITTEYITLQQLLKMEDFISSGGQAKYFLAENEAYINNEPDNRRGRKLYSGDVVKILNKEFVIE
ncbi:MAG: S4 domain-containing protein YaaA [Erysipelotrichaceae bacterium]|nr:S4 domain-containing protein YaaA [Erysipelotrichaceae bacterium]